MEVDRAMGDNSNLLGSKMNGLPTPNQKQAETELKSLNILRNRCQCTSPC